MRSLVLVHGAGSGPWVFDGWGSPADGARIAVDLLAGLRPAEASMLNYEAAVARAAEGLHRPLALVGWSAGGLVAMLAARRVDPDALVLLEPSPPAEVRGFDAAVRPAPGTYDAEPFPEELLGRRRPDSELARAERARGVSVPKLPARTLVVHGDAYPPEWGAGVARAYGAEELRLPGAGHWDLVLGTAARDAALAWAARTATPGGDPPAAVERAAPTER